MKETIKKEWCRTRTIIFNRKDIEEYVAGQCLILNDNKTFTWLENGNLQVVVESRYPDARKEFR